MTRIFHWFFMWKMDLMSGFDIRLLFTLPPRDSTLQYKGCAHLRNNFPCIITLGCCNSILTITRTPCQIYNNILWDLYLINNVKDILAFLAWKVFNSDQYSSVFTEAEIHKSRYMNRTWKFYSNIFFRNKETVNFFYKTSDK